MLTGGGFVMLHTPYLYFTQRATLTLDFHDTVTKYLFY